MLMRYSNILDYFPGNPRDVQADILKQLMLNWDSYDVHVLSLPVAAGKSHIAMCLAKWVSEWGTARIVTPTNQLLYQYYSDFPNQAYLWRKETHARGCRKCSSRCVDAVGACAFSVAKRRAQNASLTLSTTTGYQANKLYGNVLIMDEAHKMVNMLRDRALIKIWRKDHDYDPLKLITKADVIEWLESRPKLHAAKRAMRSGLYVPVVTTEKYRGKLQDVIRLEAMVANGGWKFWGAKQTEKLVLMSGTINKLDLEELRLTGYRVKVYDNDSPIHPSLRPVRYEPQIDMRYDVRDPDKLAGILHNYAEDHVREKGLIHSTYEVAAQLAGILTSDRFIFHTKHNKLEKFREFRKNSEAKVLVACGMHEGVDLPDEDARWQVITQVPYASLADPVVAARAEHYPRVYKWDAIKTIIQASGRIVRNASDFGLTSIIDAQFGDLYRGHKDLFPAYFRESLWLGDIS